ncbi:MAG: B12-binding domain-containing radical SAM protein [Spirochaetota bacterium]
MKRKVLLVYPEIPITYWSFKYSLEFIGKKTIFPPLGLLTVAAMLPEEWELKLVDLNAETLDPADVADADMAFLSAMMIQQDSFREVVSLCREHGTTVVAGGPYATSSHHEIDGVDHFILNEAEVTLPLFLNDLEKDKAVHIYEDETRPDITKSPVPRFDLIDPDVYSSMPLQFSRGCPFNCEFCDIIELFGRVPRTKDPDQFVRELDTLVSVGDVRSVFIVDDNLIGNKKRVKDLLRAIVAWQKNNNYPVSFQAETSINLADDEELLDLMEEAAFDMVFVGIETPDEETLKSTQKLQNIRGNMLENVEKIQRRGIEVTAGFIVGFDSDPEDIFDVQIDWIQRSGIIQAMVGLLDALPNTQLYRRLQKEGRLLGDSSGNNTHDLDLNFIPKMPVSKVIPGYLRVLSEIYDPENYFERAFELYKRLPGNKKVYRPFTKREARALFLSFYRQTFSRYGHHYLRFLWKSLRYDARLFSEAVAMAIKGYHLFKITGMLLEEDVNMYIENAEKAVPGSWLRRGTGAPGSKKKVALQGLKA